MDGAAYHRQLKYIDVGLIFVTCQNIHRSPFFKLYIYLRRSPIAFVKHAVTHDNSLVMQRTLSIKNVWYKKTLNNEEKYYVLRRRFCSCSPHSK